MTRSLNTILGVIERADELFKEFGLDGWNFTIDSNGNHNIGWCNHQRFLIAVNRYYIRDNPPEMIEDVLRHEIAHALLGPGYEHGPEWQRMAILCGANPESRIPHAVNNRTEKIWK